MKTIQQVLLCALLTALTVLAGYTAILIHAATVAVSEIPGQLALTRRELLQEAHSTSREVLVRTDRQVTGIRADAAAQFTGFRETADRRVGDVLVRADAAIDAVNAIRQDLKPVLDHSAAITAQVDDSLPLFLDCDHNPDCVFNRYVGASKGIERASNNLGAASDEVRGALPKMLLTWNQIGVSVSGTAGNLDRITKPHWYDRVIGYALNGIVIYRNLNPITNITLRGVQTLSARP